MDPEEQKAMDERHEKSGNKSGYYDGETWEDIRWLKQFTHLPVVVKGVLTGR